MKRVKSLIFNTFNIFENKYKTGSELIANSMINLKYSDETGFGFSNVEVDDNILSAKVLKRTPTYIQDYNIESQEIVRKQIFLFSNTQFFIDFNHKIIYVLGGVSQMNYIKNVLKNSFDFDYEAEPIEISPAKFYTILYDKNIKSYMEQIIINKFNYNNGLVGRFSGLVTNQSVGAELIEEYKSDVVKILFRLNFEEEEDLLIQVFQNGNIKFLTDESDFEFYLSFIKTVIFS